MQARFKVAALSSLVIASILTTSLVYADPPSEGDIRQSQQKEKNLQNAAASLQLQLTDLAVKRDEAQRLADQATEASRTADAKLNESIGQAIAAQEAVNEAERRVKKSREELGKIGASMYRMGAANLTMAANLLKDGNLNDAATFQAVNSLLGKHVNEQVEGYNALLSVAEVLRKKANAASEQAKEQAKIAEEAAKIAEQRQAEAKRVVDTTETERDSLLSQLAVQEGVTKELVVKRQAYLDEQRRIAEQERQRQEAERRKAEEAARKAAEAEAAQRRAAEEAARQRAIEEEARRKQEAEERARREAEENRRNNPAPAPAPEEDDEDDSVGGSSSGQPMPAVPGNTSELRKQIVAYARSYDGVPYVWGGVDPSGWDCVGFVHYVYQHFGYNTPRRTGYSVGEFWGAYRTVPASQAKPGDVLWWPRHVGLYTGNGSHIAAWNENWGTQERAVWGDPVYIRVLND